MRSSEKITVEQLAAQKKKRDALTAKLAKFFTKPTPPPMQSKGHLKP